MTTNLVKKYKIPWCYKNTISKC